MKAVKLILLTCGMICVIGQSKTYAQDENNSQTVIIRMFESFSMFKGTIMVLHPDGASHSVEIDVLKLKDFETTSANNSRVLQKEMNDWKEKEFKVDGISVSNAGDNVIITTIIMSKD